MNLLEAFNLLDNTYTSDLDEATNKLNQEVPDHLTYGVSFSKDDINNPSGLFKNAVNNPNCELTSKGKEEFSSLNILTKILDEKKILKSGNDLVTPAYVSMSGDEYSHIGHSNRRWYSGIGLNAQAIIDKTSNNYDIHKVNDAELKYSYLPDVPYTDEIKKRMIEERLSLEKFCDISNDAIRLAVTQIDNPPLLVKVIQYSNTGSDTNSNTDSSKNAPLYTVNFGTSVKDTHGASDRPFTDTKLFEAFILYANYYNKYIGKDIDKKRLRNKNGNTDFAAAHGFRCETKGISPLHPVVVPAEAEKLNLTIDYPESEQKADINTSKNKKNNIDTGNTNTDNTDDSFTATNYTAKAAIGYFAGAYQGVPIIRASISVMRIDERQSYDSLPEEIKGFISKRMTNEEAAKILIGEVKEATGESIGRQSLKDVLVAAGASEAEYRLLDAEDLIHNKSEAWLSVALHIVTEVKTADLLYHYFDEVNYASRRDPWGNLIVLSHIPRRELTNNGIKFLKDYNIEPQNKYIDISGCLEKIYLPEKIQPLFTVFIETNKSTLLYDYIIKNAKIYNLKVKKTYLQKYLESQSKSNSNNNPLINYDPLIKDIVKIITDLCDECLKSNVKIIYFKSDKFMPTESN